MGALAGGLFALLSPGQAEADKFRYLSDMADMSEFRSMTGSENNETQPEWGRAETPMLRFAAPDYADGIGAPSGENRPNPRAISNAVLDQGTDASPAASGLSDFFWQWGQFIDHDIVLTPGAVPGEMFNIEVPTGDPHLDPFFTGTQLIPFFRSNYVYRDGVRQQRNLNSAYIDASMVYGSDVARAGELRMYDGTGRLKFGKGHMLPRNPDSFPNEDDRFDPDLFLAGDVRANEQVALTAVHTLFMREHNYWTRKVWREMKRENKRRRKSGEPQVELDGDFVYELCRSIVAAEIQAITYDDWLPLLLGEDALPDYAGYDPAIDAGISNEFATAAFRFGHSMLSSDLQLLKRNGNEWRDGPLALRDAFFNAPEHLKGRSLAPILRGLATQPARELDERIVDDVRNMLFGPPGAGGMDLGALNIQRGRDHGLPSYNRTRQDYGLAPAASFADITGDPARQARLAAAYPTVDDVDLWVGGLAEDDVPGALVGETFFTIMVEQFAALRDGDRFWYRNRLGAEMTDFIESQTLRDILRRNTRVGNNLPENVFLAP